MKKFIITGVLILTCLFLYLIAGFMGPANDVIKVVIAYGTVVAWISLSAIITRKINRKIDKYIKKLS